MLRMARYVRPKNSWVARIGGFNKSNKPFSPLNHDATIQPKSGLPMKGLTDIAGIRVGHASDFEALTGATVILTEAGAVAGVDIRGSASGTAEFDVMSPLHITE